MARQSWHDGTLKIRYKDAIIEDARLKLEDKP